MRADSVIQRLRARWKHPAFLVVGLVLLTLPTLVAIAIPNGSMSFRNTLAIEAAILVFTLGIALSPVPWQWSGNDRPMAPWWRGILQLIPLLLFIATLLLAVLPIADSFHHGNVAFRLGIATGLGMEMIILLIPIGLVIARLERLGQEAMEAEQQAREVKWMSNRGSFSPRLLFNNLQHLADLAHHDTRGTEQGLLDLAALYRQGLIEAEHPLVSLATERALAEQYLALERDRWGAHLRVRWHLNPELDRVPVPPLVLLPLLEAILAPGPVCGHVHLDVHMEQVERESRTHLRLSFDQRGEAPPPTQAVEAAILQRIQSVCLAGGHIESHLKSDIKGCEQVPGWELRLWIPLPEELP